MTRDTSVAANPTAIAETYLAAYGEPDFSRRGCPGRAGVGA